MEYAWAMAEVAEREDRSLADLRRRDVSKWSAVVVLRGFGFRVDRRRGGGVVYLGRGTVVVCDRRELIALAREYLRQYGLPNGVITGS